MGFGDFLLGGSQQYEGQFRRISESDRPTSIMITWAHTEKYVAPTCKEDFMRRIGDRLEDSQKSRIGRNIIGPGGNIKPISKGWNHELTTKVVNGELSIARIIYSLPCESKYQSHGCIAQ